MNSSREYQGWSLGNRSFMTGLAISILWHFFWFYSINIVVAPAKKMEKPRPALVSLGPVMDDDILRTLVDTRTESSQSFYRRPSDFAPAENLPAQKVEPFVSGDVVSLPVGERVSSGLKQSLEGSKASPNFDWPSEK